MKSLGETSGVNSRTGAFYLAFLWMGGLAIVALIFMLVFGDQMIVDLSTGFNILDFLVNLLKCLGAALAALMVAVLMCLAIKLHDRQLLVAYGNAWRIEILRFLTRSRISFDEFISCVESLDDDYFLGYIRNDFALALFSRAQQFEV